MKTELAAEDGESAGMPRVEESVIRSGAAHGTATGAHVRAETRRVASFLVVGATSALVNLAVVTGLVAFAGWNYLPAALVASEAGILESFLLNDRLTFSDLARHAAPWPTRCLRFHGAAATGQVLAILGAATLIHVVDFPPIAAQACALAAITVFNFAAQRLFTYAQRGARSK